MSPQPGYRVAHVRAALAVDTLAQGARHGAPFVRRHSPVLLELVLERGRKSVRFERDALHAGQSSTRRATRQRQPGFRAGPTAPGFAPVTGCPWWITLPGVKFYRFDGVDDRLELVPMAARRALDHAGLKLSLAGWRSLSIAARRELTLAGSGHNVDDARVRPLVEDAEPPAEPVEVTDEPSHTTPPPAVDQVFGGERAVPPALWAALAPLDRYALAKVASRGRPERIAEAYREIVGHTATSTHLAPEGGVRMVDVRVKDPTMRRAVAASRVRMNEEAFRRLAQSEVPKGDVLATARVAGIMAAKRTSELIPLCHPVALTHVAVDIALESEARVVAIRATAEAYDRTGVEMEAIVAATITALTVYDMLKAFDRAMDVGPTHLVSKTGGRSGEYTR